MSRPIRTRRSLLKWLLLALVIVAVGLGLVLFVAHRPAPRTGRRAATSPEPMGPRRSVGRHPRHPELTRHRHTECVRSIRRASQRSKRISASVRGSCNRRTAAPRRPALGQTANWQTMASLTLASGEVPFDGRPSAVPAGKLDSDPARLTRARFPLNGRPSAASPSRHRGDRPDQGRKRAVWLRSGRRGIWPERGISSCAQRAGIALGRRRPASSEGLPSGGVTDLCCHRPWPAAQRHIPDSPSIAVESMLAGATCRLISWCRGTKGRLAPRFTAVRVRVAGGPTQRIGDMGAQHMPGDEVRLVGETPLQR